MTVPSNVSWGSAIGTGITGAYAIPFGLYTQSWLKVLTVVNNVPSFPVLGTDYTFTSWTPDNKGWVANPQINFTNTVAGGTLIVFILMPPGTQETAITNFSAFLPRIHEMTFDQLTQLSLMLLQWVGKSIKAPDWEQAGATNLTLPAISIRALQFPFFDASGNLTTSTGVTPPSVAVTTYMATLLAESTFSLFMKAIGVPIQPYLYNPPSFTGSFNDFDPTSGAIASVSMLILTPTGNVTLTGLEAVDVARLNPSSQIMPLFNNSAFSITLKSQSASSASTNKFFTNGNVDYVMAAGETVMLAYATNGGTGGGGWSVIS